MSSRKMKDIKLMKIEEKLGITLPKTLREFYLTTRSYYSVSDTYFGSPDWIYLEGPNYDEDLREENENYPNVLIIAEHYQGCYYWRIDVNDLEEEDPPILYYQDDDECEWERTGLRCHEFMNFMKKWRHEIDILDKIKNLMEGKR
ncbi:MAG: SMI1/KNR4 family protein [Promethearchaeota archaeon]